MKRRAFCLYTGATALALAGCQDDTTDDGPADNRVNVGTGDLGVLNFAYALEQLEAAFYTELRSHTYYTSAPAFEKSVLDDLYRHEVIHRETFRLTLTTGAIKALKPDFSAIDFDVRTAAAGATKMGILDAAMAFEDLGVSAYNGAAKYISNSNYLTLAGKIVSVEARHAALIRDLIRSGNFVGPDVVDASTGLEISRSPTAVADLANKFLLEGSKLNVAGIK